MRRKGGLLLFISACIPGCGQMYQGYMKRGSSLLGLCCLVIAISGILNLGELAIFLPLIWLFAFYDTYNLRGQSDEEAAANPDGWLFGLENVDGERMRSVYKKRHSLIGIILIALGVYALYNTVLGGIMEQLPESLNWLSDLVMYTIPRMVVILLLIALGVWFIRGPKKQTPEADFTAYTPPSGTGGPDVPPYEDGAPVAPQPPIILKEETGGQHGNN